jgi:hypothetical protein
VIHPHPESRWITVTIAAIDLRRAALRLVPGTEDLAWAKLPVDKTSGLVPEADRASLVAVMNGGFQPKHGRWGLVRGTTSVTPPRDGACTIGIEASGQVRIGPSEALAPSLTSFDSIRQTPPCLVHDGAVHPDLIAGRDKRWAGQKADLKTRRRSAIGIDGSGTILFYALGEEAEARWLAEGLRLAGAVSAAQLDINWYWTRFLVFGTDASGKLGVTSTLIPKTEHHHHGYVERASTRDFFYVVRK